jgi:hypothetical protein
MQGLRSHQSMHTTDSERCDSGASFCSNISLFFRIFTAGVWIAVRN